MLRTTFQKLTTLALIILGVSFLSCSPKLGTEMEYDFILTKSDLDHSKGTILIIQGAAPTNVDGRIPVDADIIYAKKSFNKNLADDLNKLGWDVVRYGKYGVYLNKIDWDKYRKTDLNFTLKQLRDVWQRVPSDKPLIVLALSEGTLHAGHLPLQDTKALILLGAIATNIKDVYLNKAKDDEELKKRTEKLESAHDMKRDEMFDKSWPAGRVVD
ncbi:hypothetical protein KKA04_05315, partial [Patescibacteria group bacterium]|nr:hypothetical protein [Patescibacteria group bacterium]